MRRVGTLFLVAACVIAPVAQSQDRRNPQPPRPPGTDVYRPGAYQPPQKLPHPQPEPPSVEPHPGHEGHDLRNAAIGAGAGFLAGWVLGHALASKDPPEKILSNHGPQTPATFSMSNFSIMGFAKGNWPVVLDYEVRKPGLYLLTVSTGDSAPFSYLLDGSQTGRQQIILQLPARFGPDPKPGSYSIQAMSNVPGEVAPAYLRVFGIGAGERAVGSVAIDQLHFTPPAIKAQDRQIASYGFHSHADFEKVTAEFERVGLVDGSVVTQIEDQQDIKDVVRRNTSIQNQQWDPRKRKAKPGQHMLQVRAWYTLKGGGDWVVAWSPELVRVEE